MFKPISNLFTKAFSRKPKAISTPTGDDDIVQYRIITKSGDYDIPYRELQYWNGEKWACPAERVKNSFGDYYYCSSEWLDGNMSEGDMERFAWQHNTYGKLRQHFARLKETAKKMEQERFYEEERERNLPTRYLS